MAVLSPRSGGCGASHFVALMIFIVCITQAQGTTTTTTTSRGDLAQPINYTEPFYRLLYVKNPPMQGSDVIILQTLLNRRPWSPTWHNLTSGIYDSDTANTVKVFQQTANISVDGMAGPVTCDSILSNFSADGYHDTLSSPLPYHYMYKIYVPVHTNRSIETTATLYDRNMTQLHQFTVRTHGQDDPFTGLAYNEFAPDGSTPTGLMTLDLNSPESNATLFGPYPVNRAVTGIEGNAFTISDIRDGILVHTGEWAGWNPSMPMPDSHGCVHAHPTDIKAVWQILTTQLGVQVRNNTGGALPYPYSPQGLLSIELID